MQINVIQQLQKGKQDGHILHAPRFMWGNKHHSVFNRFTFEMDVQKQADANTGIIRGGPPVLIKNNPHSNLLNYRFKPRETN